MVTRLIYLSILFSIMFGSVVNAKGDPFYRDFKKSNIESTDPTDFVCFSVNRNGDVGLGLTVAFSDKNIINVYNKEGVFLYSFTFNQSGYVFQFDENGNIVLVNFRGVLVSTFNVQGEILKEEKLLASKKNIYADLWVKKSESFNGYQYKRLSNKFVIKNLNDEKIELWESDERIPSIWLWLIGVVVIVTPYSFITFKNKRRRINPSE